MIISTLAYEIGGVFLLAALVMYGTMVQGFIPNIFRNAKLAGLVVGVVALGLAAYRWFPEMSAGVRSVLMPDAAGGPQASVTPVPTEPAPAPKQPIKQAQPGSRTVVLHGVGHPSPPETTQPPESAPLVSRDTHSDAPEPAQPAPGAAKVDPGPATDAPQENRAKRTVKSVGRFLHIQRDDPDREKLFQTEKR